MIQAALELEVEEFLQRGKYDKTGKDEFRGHRDAHHQTRTVSTAVGGLTVIISLLDIMEKGSTAEIGI